MMLALVRDSWRNPPLALQQVGEPQPGPGECSLRCERAQ